MVQISGEESHLELKAAENVDITDLLLFIENLMAEIDDIKNPFADDDDTEEAEEHEYDGWTLADEVKRYQKEFQKYADMIKMYVNNMDYGKGLQEKAIYTNVKNEKPDIIKPEAGKSAFEFKDFSIPDYRKSPFEEEKMEMHRNEHSHDHSDYPCGGKLRGMFRHGFLKYTLEGINKDRGMMNYLAV